MFDKVKKSVEVSIKRCVCDHDYSIKSLSGSTVSFKCVKCGKEIHLHQSRAPLELLTWGYSWYHGKTPDGETMDLLLHQRIAKNNEVMVPMRKVYVVSLLEKLDVVPYKDGHGSRIDLGDIRVVGIGFEEEKNYTSEEIVASMLELWEITYRNAFFLPGILLVYLFLMAAGFILAHIFRTLHKGFTEFFNRWEQTL